MTKIPYIRSLRDVKSVSQARIYSIPKQQRSVHLDLYVLAREKDRLEKELFQVQMKSRLIKKKLAQSNKRMNELLQEIGRLHQGDKGENHSQAVKAKVKKMSIEY